MCVCVCNLSDWLSIFLYVHSVFSLHRGRTEIYDQRKWKVQRYEKQNLSPCSSVAPIICLSEHLKIVLYCEWFDFLTLSLLVPLLECQQCEAREFQIRHTLYSEGSISYISY